MIRDWLLQRRWHAVGSGFVRIAAMTAAAGAAAVAPHDARAQAPYPSKPMRVVGAKLGDILGQQVYVENRAGASGNIATEAVARAGTDGYTLLMASLSN